MIIFNRLDTLVVPITTEEDFKKFLADGDKVFVVDVYRDWCGPCSTMKANIDKIYIDTEECEERVNFGSVNFDKNPELVEQYVTELSCKPMFLIFKKGDLRMKIEGCDAPTFINTVKGLMPDLKVTE